MYLENLMKEELEQAQLLKLLKIQQKYIFLEIN